MLNQTQTKRPRGRPPKTHADQHQTRQQLIRKGMELLTERGYSATGIDAILKAAAIPRGSFYHYFSSKDQFVIEVIHAYAAFFARLLDRHLTNIQLEPLARINAFVNSAAAGMARYEFRRGCLLGNLGQELTTLPEVFRFEIAVVFNDWESRLADCLRLAQKKGEIPADADVNALAYLFWVGWEGAVLRARLERSERPLRLFNQQFLSNLNRSD